MRTNKTTGGGRGSNKRTLSELPAGFGYNKATSRNRAKAAAAKPGARTEGPKKSSPVKKKSLFNARGQMKESAPKKRGR